MHNPVHCSAGFFLEEERSGLWYLLGIFLDFDAVKLPTFKSVAGEKDAHDLMVRFFRGLGLGLGESKSLAEVSGFFREADRFRERLGEGEGEVLKISHTIMGSQGMIPPLARLSVGQAEVIEHGGKERLCGFWKLDDFFSKSDEETRRLLRPMMPHMIENRRFLQANSRFILDLNKSR
ncbi:MAG: hypothetical protein KGH93_03010 [Patescibacteria group bacterium]|nr:hypothetical protein [Patescibacteria group bacterium]MDE1946140.1 hypothetical protein [Patescibacteria group bacterium]